METRMYLVDLRSQSRGIDFIHRNDFHCGGYTTLCLFVTVRALRVCQTTDACLLMGFIEEGDLKYLAMFADGSVCG